MDRAAMSFEFASPTRIVFGCGKLGEIGPAARALGRHALVVTGRDPQRATRLREVLAAAGVNVTTCSIAGEPTTDAILRGTDAARAGGCDLVIGFGGGSAVDAAKAIAALLTNGGELSDYLEVIGRAQPLAHAAAPCIAIPTTGGTGSEVTRNAVLTSPAHRLKVSLRSAHLLPRIAWVDPELACALPPALTAATGLDALTQLVEAHVSARANPLTGALCAAGIRRAARALRRAVADGRDSSAREDMAFASLCSGLALANAGLGAVHGFAAPIGGAFSAPHGAICAALLPHAMAANLAALRLRAPGHTALAGYDEIARLLTGDAAATADDGVRWVARLVTDLQIPSLRHHGIAPGDFGGIVTAAAKASSMKANPVVLTPGELTGILESAF